eukprot:CAMPEP_0185758494 /NCGR_PEP_ID=MMETSP1174-20130828/17164_1 /TAXON_ID=35687 /ORGANISM="Dictyocha speculum, Strain CCMP1381" /LENGTH=84 /DNA_ID=CAMNT_0028438377 /DNA_START=438 /DNA_END=692 /DNA_ORIENTATION=-
MLDENGEEQHSNDHPLCHICNLVIGIVCVRGKQTDAFPIDQRREEAIRDLVTAFEDMDIGDDDSVNTLDNLPVPVLRFVGVDEK